MPTLLTVFGFSVFDAVRGVAKKEPKGAAMAVSFCVVNVNVDIFF
jgi:hypothetical protein